MTAVLTMSGALQFLGTGLKRLQVGERLVRRNPLYYGAIQRDMRSLQPMNLRQRMNWTERRLTAVHEIALATRYAQELRMHERHAWPLLRKESVRDDPVAFHTKSSWFNARAHTGGTTGTPLELVRSPQSVVAEQVCLDLMLSLTGADPRTARIAVLRGDNIKPPSDRRPPFWMHALGGRRLLMSSNHLGDETLPAYVDAIRQFAPDVLWVYPSALESLCRLLMRAGAELPVPRILSSSEMLPSSMWPMVRTVLGASVVDYYGQAERVAFAYATQPGEYYFLPGYASVELLREPSDTSGCSYEIVGTSLWNTAMPLIRYRTGDLIRLPQPPTPQELLEIVYGLRSFPGVIGRNADVLVAPDGVGVLTGIDHIPRGVASLLRLQVVQESLDRVTLRALVTDRFTEQDAEQLLRNARLKIPITVDVRLTVVDELERTALGKTPFVIHAPQVKAAFNGIGLIGGR